MMGLERPGAADCAWRAWHRVALSTDRTELSTTPDPYPLKAFPFSFIQHVLECSLDTALASNEHG